MSVDFLNASLANAFSLTKAASTRSASPRTIWDAMSGPDYSAGREAEQLIHFRGRFYSAARILIERFAMQPIYCAERRKNRRDARLDAIIPPAWAGDPALLDVQSFHPVLEALRHPNSELTEFNLKETIAASLVVTGRGFLVALKGEKRTFDLFAIPATWMTRTSRSEWKILPPGAMGEGVKVSTAQVMHCYFADPSNPASVISPMSMIARSILADEAIEGAQLAEFKNGPMPKVALIAGDTTGAKNFSEDPDGNTRARPVRLEPHQRRQIVTWYQQQFAGVQRYGLPMVLDSIIQDVKVLSRKPQEMAYQESGSYLKQNVFEALGVSKILTGQLDGTNRAGGELAESLMVDNTLNPMITLFGQALTKTLGPLYSMGADNLVIWMEPAAPRQDEVLIEKLRIATRYYSVTRNELRRALNLGLPQRDGMDDIVIPQTLEEREPDEDLVGIGRLPKPAPVAPASNGKFHLNGRH